MKKVCILLITTLVLLAPAVMAADSLAQKLPAETTVYAYLDLSRVIKEGPALLRFIDEDHGSAVVAQIKELYAAGKLLAARYQFTPTLFNHLPELTGYFVLMKKAQPETTTHSYEVPKWDPNTGEIKPGETETRSYTTTKRYTASFILETTPDIAMDFMNQIKGLVVRETKKDASFKGQPFKEIDMGRGKMIELPDDSGTLGCMGNYIIFSDSKPTKLWRALMAPSSTTLARNELYGRYMGKTPKPNFIVLANLEQLTKDLETSLRDNLAEAKKKAADKKDAANDPYGGGQWQLKAAETSLNSFLNAKKMLGLDKLKTSGAQSGFTLTERTFDSDVTMSCHFSGPMAPMMKALMNGGRAFSSPGVEKKDGVSILFRIGVKEILAEVLRTFPPSTSPGMAQVTTMFKGQTGLDMETVVGQLSGDIYTLMNMVEKEREVPEYDEQADDWKTVKKTVPQPEFMVLAGVNDPKAFKTMLTQIFAKLSLSPTTAQMVKKTVYQQNDMYLLGPGVAAEAGGEQNPANVFAATICGRYFSFGTADDMRSFIRRSKAASSGVDMLGRVISAHPGCSLLVAAPKTFGQRIRKMMEKEAGGDVIEQAIKQIEDAPIIEEDKELDARIRKALTAFLEHYNAIGKKAETMGNPITVITGKLAGQYYDIEASESIKK